MKPSFTLMAAVDISSGTAGALDHGAVDPSARYGDPLTAARHWVNEGAEWIHVQDLDATAGTGSNAAQVAAIARDLRGRAHVQLAGITDAQALDAALALRPQRVVLASAALADPGWLATAFAAHGDVLAGELAAHGSSIHAPGSSAHGMALDDAVIALENAGCRTFVVTDVDAEGSRHGSKRHALQLVCELERHHVIAGGGIALLGDLHHLFEMVPRGLQGAVIDRALYEEAFTWSEAVVAAEPHVDLFFWGPPQP